MINKEKNLGLGFEHKNYNKFSDVNDYRHPRFSFLLCLKDGSVQVITASNKGDGPIFREYSKISEISPHM